MNFSTLSRVSTLLRHGDVVEAAGGLLKVAGAGLDTLVTAAKAIDRGAVTAGKHLTDAGHPLMGTALRVSPYVAAGIGVKKVNESEPVQRVKAKINEIQYNRAMKRAQRGY